MMTAKPGTIANDSLFCEAHTRVDDLIAKLTSPEAMRATMTDIERCSPRTVSSSFADSSRRTSTRASLRAK